jgi:hypothetical protein
LNLIMKTWCRLALAVVLWVPSGATTLEQLGMADMIQKSTAIVRAKVTGSSAAYRGADIYTYYHLQVIENLKASTADGSDVAVPGGAVRGVQQTVAGAPSLRVGEEYVLFLWTSRSGLTQVIGLSQGLFAVKEDSAGESVLLRPATSEMMLDSSGRVVRDEGIRLRLGELRTRVRQGAGK